jgi:hypothetical protein
MSIKCGNHGGIDIRHETVADVRACFASPNGVADFAPTTEGVRFPVADRLTDREEVFASNVAQDDEVWPWAKKSLANAHATSPVFRSPVRAEASATLENTERHHTPRPARRNEATEPMKGFVRLLLAERDWQSVDHQSFIAETAGDFLFDGRLSFDDAKRLIPALKELPKVGRAESEKTERSRPAQPWKVLSEQVPAGNYKVTAEDGKNHFYRVSVGQNGFYKIQERASEALHFVALVRYAGILQAILDAGVEAARLAYSQDQKRCWHCGLRLTDNTGNPHYGRGLGPHCGEEH